MSGRKGGYLDIESVMEKFWFVHGFENLVESVGGGQVVRED